MSTPRAPLPPKQDRSTATRRKLLDAAVDELLASGYAGLTTSAVAHRAGVSRGAQQHHFPHKDGLVAEAVRHLADRQREALRTGIAAAPRGRARARHALDAIYAQYSGPLFAAMVELSLAARHGSDLAAILSEQERALGVAIEETAQEIFAEPVRRSPSFAGRWALALGTIRGIAMLRLLGHPADVVDRQWAAARRELLALLG
jgi:AcrR family transcriptional regulator